MLRILHITHPWGGGISTYINDLQKESDSNFIIYTLKCYQGLARVSGCDADASANKEYYLGLDIKLTDYSNEKYADILSKVLHEFEIDIVHIDSAVGHTFDIFTVPAINKIPLVCVIHDFFYICPTFHLVDNNGAYCNISCKDTNDCNKLTNNEYLCSPFTYKDLLKFRSIFTSLKTMVNVFVFPSSSSKKIFQTIYELDEEQCVVIEHGTSLDKVKPLESHDKCDVLRVGILGSMLKHKGKSTIQSVMAKMADLPVEFYHFGDGDLSGKNLVSLGRYDQNNILKLLSEKDIDVILLLSSWPETFSYTLSEAISANIPPIVSNLGALEERVSKDGIGWVVNFDDVEDICFLIERLATNRDEILLCREKIAGLKLKTLPEMCLDYKNLYVNILLNQKHSPEKTLHAPLIPTTGDHTRSYLAQFATLKLIQINSLICRLQRKLKKVLSR